MMVGVPEKERTGPDEAISTQEHKTLRENGEMSKVDTFRVSKPKTVGWNRLATIIPNELHNQIESFTIYSLEDDLIIWGENSSRNYSSKSS